MAYKKKQIKKGPVPYKTSLKLRKNPFSDRFDPDCLYSNPQLDQRTGVLKHLIGGDDFLILVAGEPGAGKTNLLKNYMENSGKSWQTCRLWAHGRGEYFSEERLEHLNGHPAYILEDIPHPVLILDNAHELTSTELEFLFKLAGKSGYIQKLSKIVLFSEPSIIPRLEKLSDKIPDKGVINKIFISPFNEKQTEDYITFRLKCAGYRGKPLFSPPEIKIIYDESEGFPGKINDLAHRYLIKNHSGQEISLFNKIAAGSVIAFITATPFMFGSKIGSYFLSKRFSFASKPQTEITSTISYKVKSPLAANVEKNSRRDKKAVKSEIEDKKRGIFRESWILAQPSSYYTLQVLGVTEETAIMEFVKLYNLTDKVAYFKTRHDGKDWFPLLYGMFSSSSEAQSAISSLPPELKVTSPWVRKLSSVHTAIKQEMRRTN